MLEVHTFYTQEIYKTAGRRSEAQSRYFITELIEMLQSSSSEVKEGAAKLLLSYARERKCLLMVLQEHGVRPLLSLLQEGRPKGQQAAVAMFCRQAGVSDPENPGL